MKPLPEEPGPPRESDTKALIHPDRPGEIVIYRYRESLEGWIAGEPVEVTQ